MERNVTYAIELLVGLACLGLAAVTWRQRGMLRAVAVVSAGAGAVAVAHAILELAQ